MFASQHFALSLLFFYDWISFTKNHLLDAPFSDPRQFCTTSHYSETLERISSMEPQTAGSPRAVYISTVHCFGCPSKGSWINSESLTSSALYIVSLHHGPSRHKNWIWGPYPIYYFCFCEQRCFFFVLWVGGEWRKLHGERWASDEIFSSNLMDHCSGVLWRWMGRHELRFLCSVW